MYLAYGLRHGVRCVTLTSRPDISVWDLQQERMSFFDARIRVCF